MYLVFKTKLERDQVFNVLLKIVSDDCITTEKNVEYYTEKWVAGDLNNFDYLMLLNSYAQRSMRDLTQYPVMPWVIKDYKSQFIDLTDPMIYRDLSQPIGALDVSRLKEF